MGTPPIPLSSYVLAKRGKRMIHAAGGVLVLYRIPPPDVIMHNSVPAEKNFGIDGTIPPVSASYILENHSKGSAPVE